MLFIVVLLLQAIVTQHTCPRQLLQSMVLVFGFNCRKGEKEVFCTYSAACMK